MPKVPKAPAKGKVPKKPPPQVKTFTPNQIAKLAYDATHNGSSSKVMLGMWDGGGAASYVTRAGKDYTFYQLSHWDELKKIYGEEEMWKINAKFIDDQIAAGKEFFFSHNPFSAKTNTGLSREAELLIDRGVTDFIRVGENLWKAVW